MELWDLYTFDRKPAGLTHIRREKVPEGLGPLALENATTGEAARCCWLTRKEIQVLSDSGLLVPALSYFFDIFK